MCINMYCKLLVPSHWQKLPSSLKLMASETPLRSRFLVCFWCFPRGLRFAEWFGVIGDWLCLELYIYIYPETFRFWMYVYKLSSCNSLWPRVYPEKSSSKQFSHVWWVSLPRNKFCHKDCLLLVGETQHIVIKRFSGCQKNGLYIAEGQNMKNTIENPSL